MATRLNDGAEAPPEMLVGIRKGLPIGAEICFYPEGLWCFHSYIVTRKYKTAFTSNRRVCAPLIEMRDDDLWMSLTETSKCHLIKLFILRKEVTREHDFDGGFVAVSADFGWKLLLD